MPDVDAKPAKAAHRRMLSARKAYEKACRDREQAWLALSRAGWSMRRIAAEMGVSHERVQDAVSKARQRDT